jgi:hypothetical protein
MTPREVISNYIFNQFSGHLGASPSIQDAHNIIAALGNAGYEIVKRDVMPAAAPQLGQVQPKAWAPSHESRIIALEQSVKMLWDKAAGRNPWMKFI